MRLAEAWEQKRRVAPVDRLTAKCPASVKPSDKGQKFGTIPERVLVVRGIVRKSLANIGAFAISRRFNEDRVPVFGRSQGWAKSSVAKILSNRAVLGELHPNKLVKGKRTPVGRHCKIITRESAVTRTLSVRFGRVSRRTGSSGRKGAFLSILFSGLAVCGYCRAPLHFINKGSSARGGTSRSAQSLKGLCASGKWSYADFENIIVSALNELDLGSLFNSEHATSTREKLRQKVEILSGELWTYGPTRKNI